MLPKPPTSRPNTTHNLTLLAASLGNSLSRQRVCLFVCPQNVLLFLNRYWLRASSSRCLLASSPTPGRKRKEFFPKGSFICFISAFDHAQTNNFPFSLECAAAVRNGPVLFSPFFMQIFETMGARVSFGKFRVAILLLVFVELL